MSRKLLMAAAGFVAVSCRDLSEPMGPAPIDSVPAVRPSAVVPEFIPGQYIVVLRDDVVDVRGFALDQAGRYGRIPQFVFEDALKGFTVQLPEPAVAALARLPQVAYIEQDQIIRGTGTQAGATWGIDRIDQRNLPLSGSFTYGATGAGVTAYILDTGIRFDHSEFGGRAVSGFDAVDGGSADDCNGHGTHVAGTVGGSNFGVAKNVRLVAVRVLNCSQAGTTSGTVAGIDWVTANRTGPSVANMSLTGTASTALDDALRRSVAAGVTYVVAAGNSSVDACSYSPARAAEAITVGATTATDARASFSNYGSCLDVFAPGSSILSAYHTGSSATMLMTGTSMATPHVAGAAALYLESNPSASPATVASALINGATANAVSNAGSGSPNRLVYSQLSSDGGGTVAPCSGCTAYTGNLTGAGVYQIEPPAGYVYSWTSGFQTATLVGPSGANFDLYLLKWNGTGVDIVASSVNGDSSESVNYYGSPGYYIWVVYSSSGSGSYTFWMNGP